MGRVIIPGVNYVPEQGIIYLDISALTWVRIPGEYGILSEQDQVALKRPYEPVQLERVTRLLRKRRGIITTPLVRREIERKHQSLNGYITIKKNFIQKLREEGRLKDQVAEERRGIKPKILESRLLHFVLEALEENEEELAQRENGMPGRQLVYRIPYRETEAWVRETPIPTEGPYQKPLSPADKELVATALAKGHGTGIFSADKTELRTYRVGVKVFGNQRCFISDPTRTLSLDLDTYGVMGSRRNRRQTLQR